MDKHIKEVIIFLLVLQLLSFYWIYQSEQSRAIYRSLDESSKKNTAHLVSALQKKLLSLETKVANYHLQQP